MMPHHCLGLLCLFFHHTQFVTICIHAKPTPITVTINLYFYPIISILDFGTLHFYLTSPFILVRFLLSSVRHHSLTLTPKNPFTSVSSVH